MRTIGAFVVAGALCGLGLGCGAEEWEDVEGGDDEEVVERTAALDLLCDKRVHVARLPTNVCAAVGNWAGEQLFDDGVAPPGELGKYCQFTWTGLGQPTLANVSTLYNAVGSTASPSCRAITGQGDDVTDTLAPALRSFFRAAVGWVAPAELNRPEADGNPAVTVLVVDSQPTSFDVEPTSLHGKHMVNVIADIACPDGSASCGAELLLELGLPRLADGTTNYTQGGYLGTHLDVARAIYKGVRRWEQANAANPARLADPSNLIINLSLGWDPDLFPEGDPSYPKATVAAVRVALEYASCKGALVIASVGNSSLELERSSGPLLPAGWETRPAPDQTRCAALGVPTGGNAPGSYRPLVHAVGGLGLDGGPLVNRRNEGNPRLLAASSHAVAGQPMNGGLTGTSVGTAATSGVAALVWSHHEDLSAHEVMDLVYAGGQPLPAGMETHFSLVSPRPEPRRVDACEALHAACLARGGYCPAESCRTLPSPTPTQIEDALATIDGLSPVQLTMLPEADTCDVGGGAISVYVTGGEAYCEMLTMGATEHLVNPTPESIGCPTCTLQGATLVLATHPYYDSVTDERVMVTIRDTQGVRRYDLGTRNLSSNTTTTLVLDPPPPYPVREAEIAITFGTITTVNPLLVL